jgi:hypothetical protein
MGARFLFRLHLQLAVLAIKFLTDVAFWQRPFLNLDQRQGSLQVKAAASSILER